MCAHTPKAWRSLRRRQEAGRDIFRYCSHMSTSFNLSVPIDVSALLRTDAERSWLHREVIPVLRQLETRESLPDEETGAAMAYLEVTWREATARARATDSAHARLCAREAGSESSTLSGSACRYHTAVRVLRELVAERIHLLMQQPAAREPSSASQKATDDVRQDPRRPPADDRTPRAA